MEEQEITIDLLEVVQIVKRNIRQILKVTAGCLVLACLYLLVARPVYESEALLRIQLPRGIASSPLSGVEGGNVALIQQQMSTLAELLVSRDVVAPVMEQEAKENEGAKLAYESYANRIKTTPVKNTEILKITVSGKSPEDAQQTSRRLLDSFMQKITVVGNTEQSKNRKFLEQRLVLAKENLDKADIALQKFKTEHKLTSPSNSADTAMSHIKSREEQLVSNQVALETAQAKLAAVDAQLANAGAASADNQTVQKYNEQLAKLEQTRIAYLEKYTGKHPRMIDLNDQIASLKQKVAEEQARVANLQAPSDNKVHQELVAKKFASQTEVVVAQQKAESLRTALAKDNADLDKYTELQKDFARLSQEASVAKDIHSMLVKRIEEAKIAEAMQQNNVQVVNEPTLPERPAKPKKAMVLALAALLGLLFSSGYYVLQGLMHPVIRREQDVENHLGLAVLGCIPDVAALNRAEAQDTEAGSGFIGKMKEFLWKKQD
ncbi:MAG: hypothetical protein IJ601_11750 [Acidaminococcaceae bacterium]|nr:hypothetical protein [Acidaminococcaceae bacterium]